MSVSEKDTNCSEQEDDKDRMKLGKSQQESGGDKEEERFRIDETFLHCRVACR